jgi:hypothetical protein
MSVVDRPPGGLPPLATGRLASFHRRSVAVTMAAAD